MTISRVDLAASWFRFQATIRLRWAGYIGLLVLIGILGGTSLASFAAARRIESSYPAFLARTNPANLNVDIGVYNPTILERIRELPQVRSLESYVVVAWQAAVTATIGVVVGLPLGVAFGRTLWDVFARKLYVVPAPAVPVPAIFLIAFGAIALSVLVSAGPGRSAARTPTALLLRVE